MHRRLLLATLVALAACSGEGGVKDEELEGLVVAPPTERPPVNVDKATSSGVELGRALATPHHLVAPTLGAHQVKITSRLEVKEGNKVVQTLSDETTLEYAADGQYHAKYDNDAGAGRLYGREVLWQGGLLFLRPRFSRWHRRAPTDETEPQEVRDQIYAVTGDYFDLVAHAAEVTDKGGATAAGRDGRSVEIKLAPSPAKAPAQLLTQRKWRESVTVLALSGDAVLEAESGLPLQARFSTKLTFVRDGRTFTMSLEVGQDVTAIGEEVALLTPPATEVVDTPERLREVDDRDALLQGIAPSKKRPGAVDGGPVAPPATNVTPAPGKP